MKKSTPSRMYTSRKFGHPLSAIIIFSTLAFLSFALKAAELDPTQGCKTNPAVTGQCFIVKGVVSIYNGTPPVRIRPDGSKGILGVEPSEDEIMPQSLKNSIGINHPAHARMTVCPLAKKEQGLMQFVCIDSASHIRQLEHGVN